MSDQISESAEVNRRSPVRWSAWLGRVKRFLTIIAIYLSIVMIGVGLALIGPWAMITAGVAGIVIMAWIMSK